MQAQEDGARKAEGSCRGQFGQGGEKEKEEVIVFGLSPSTLHTALMSECTSIHPRCMLCML